ncbi:ribosome maturation factor RimP [Staphylospora marina]|uniref:ribosome maturation factor RimP n=1 Tax=Staphylospora marina TaxID=2490858 RepID=UPI0019D07DBE|nr:ribosome maturation factor RimP [Staphylospora marina]
MAERVTDAVAKLALPVLEAEGLELVEVEFTKEGSNRFLRVYIDRDDRPVDLDDCTRVSEKLSLLLDREDPIPEAYILEVCSPGAERPLKKDKDFRKAVGKHVHVTTYEAIDGKSVFEGVLADFDGRTLTIAERKKTVQIPLDKVAKARLAIVF